MRQIIIILDLNKMEMKNKSLPLKNQNLITKWEIENDQFKYTKLRKQNAKTLDIYILTIFSKRERYIYTSLLLSPALTISTKNLQARCKKLHAKKKSPVLRSMGLAKPKFDYFEKKILKIKNSIFSLMHSFYYL